jgi:hypothetical protein
MSYPQCREQREFAPDHSEGERMRGYCMWGRTAQRSATLLR